MRYRQILFLTALLGSAGLKASAAEAAVTGLRTEYLVNPIGIDEVHPRLKWMLKDSRSGATQTAYQLIIGTDSMAVVKGEGNGWTTDKTTSVAMLVAYAGKPLAPYSKYFWKVKVWDKDNKEISSAVNSFETGLMGERWTGAWISDRKGIDARPAPYFRKGFKAQKKIKSARAYIAVAGLYELFLNGKKVGNHRLDPMYTRFDRRNLYVSYDVTANLQQGENAIGVLLGNGWYNHQALAVWNFDRAPWRQRPAFCMDLRITYTDGTTEVIATGNDWKTKTGPITSNNIYTGEHYDSRLEIPGWNKPGFDDQKWDGISLRSAPSRQIVSQTMEPIRNVEEILPKSIKKINDTVYLVDLGRNIAGVTKLKLNGESGTVVRIKHGERLYPNGRLDMSNIDVYYRPKDDSDPFQTDIVTLNGKPVEFMAKFNYKGFQYVELHSSKPIKLSKNDVTAYFMHSDVKPAGQFGSSNEIVNKIWWASNNAYLSNLFGYPTDCPQREKNGWTGDGHFAVETGLYNFDGISVYEKWMADHRDEQQPNGVLPDIIPTGGWGYGTANGTDWTSTIAIIPWNLYLFYGDTKALSDNYSNIKAYVNYVESISKDGLTSFGRGDWVPVKSSSSLEYTSSVYFYTDALILSKTAGLFGKTEDQEYYTQLAEKIRTAINNKYFNKETCLYGSGVQTELSMALQWHVVPEEYRLQLAANLAKRVVADKMHLDVGVLGAKAVLNALSENGQEEIAYKLAAQDTYPSWGWWIANGATTLQENWDMQAPRDISQNHMMFGEVGGWFFKGLGGIKPDESAAGFKNILLRPNFVTGLSHMESEYEGPYGKIVSSWKRSGKSIAYTVVIPANSSADFQLSGAEKRHIYLDGKQLDNNYHLSAGTYHFIIK
ncbi:family 78 glycoside hydrolase catalytic domain [Pedobacter sp. MC2016-15]|uniref:alpha-L-rhamnosidase n=1 Tax=Pedobacter sp. MC2016-15 TaxID=2994473 RepID=UPI0022465F66|nr:alpha-L-rhamnosidase [Pedobacter sp. MC2016-15]MCX2478209.1 family 78 glycoside hydrolase catalytic domain [Pedobacter sp. MC2016-15]